MGRSTGKQRDTAAALPAAEVRVRLISLAEGDAEVEVAIDPDGALAAAYGTGEERFAAYQRLFETVQRELADALDVLADADVGAESDPVSDPDHPDGSADHDTPVRQR